MLLTLPYSCPKESTVDVYSGETVVASYPATKGINTFLAPGIVAGAVRIEVLSSCGESLVSASSTVDVVADTDGICSFNYQVLGATA